MQKRTLESLDSAEVPRRPAAHAAVCRIPDDRMPDRAQVDADLMRAARRDGDVQQRNAVEVARERDARHRIPRPPRPG